MDIEMNSNQREGSSRTDQEEHDLAYFSKKACDIIKNNKLESYWREIKFIIDWKSPMGNSILHIAALHGNDACIRRCLLNLGPYNFADNENGDTALHVAARAGHISILEILFCKILHSFGYLYSKKPKEGLDKILKKNKEGNTFFHEALLNGHEDVMKILVSEQLQTIEKGFLELVERVALFWTNNEEKSVVHLAIEKGYKDIIHRALTKLNTQHFALDQLIKHPELAVMIQPRFPVGTPVLLLCSSTGDLIILHERRRRIRKFQEIIVEFSKAELMDNQNSAKFIPYGKYYIPLGISPLSLAILKRDQDSLHIILREKEEWICSRDDEGRTAFHYAASIGYLHGVEKLLATDLSWQWDRDSHGLFPIHWASAGGHLKVVEKLLEYCSDPREMLDNNGRNIVHIAAQMGKLNVITYILQATKNHHVENVINDKDKFGNAPLHLASLHFHPKIVHTLTRDPGVDLTSVNKNNETALDVFMNNCQENLPLRQRLTWFALKSAGVKYSENGLHSIKDPSNSHSEKSDSKQKAPMDPYKDRINTLILVSILITTVAFAAGFTMPGGTNDSEGMAVMLKHAWFKPFIFCITISMYGSIGVTIILIWTQLGDSTLALYALKIASPLLGISLTTLSVAFVAGVYLVISDLSWLATTFLVLCAVCIVMLLLLYTILWFPSPSSKPWIRCISHYPFQFQTWLVERDDSKDGDGDGMPVIYPRQKTRGKQAQEDRDSDENEKEKNIDEDLHEESEEEEERDDAAERVEETKRSLE